MLFQLLGYRQGDVHAIGPLPLYSKQHNGM